MSSTIKFFEKISKKLSDSKLNNVRLLYRPDIELGPKSLYVHTVKEFNPESLDFVLVDGRLRDYCACSALSLIKPGGILVIDDAHRYLPCESDIPNSRKISNGPASPYWVKFIEEVINWRCIWTSLVVTDTVIWVKSSTSVE